jgi:hypothetical protein
MEDSAALSLLKRQIFSIKSESEFDRYAMEIFHYQALHNEVYNNYLNLLDIASGEIKEVSAIPFIPIELFKEKKIITGESDVDIIFRSSGTTGIQTSSHYLLDRNLYEESFLTGFGYFYNRITDYTILALLPSYIERNDSSLVYMVNRLIKESGKPDSGFYNLQQDALIKKLEQLKARNEKFILWGVSFALLDLAEKFEFDFGSNIIIETGGMKGKRKEILREEIHSFLCKRFHLDVVHSEYGMTELLSQAYSKGNGIYQAPPWMKIKIRDLNDPFDFSNQNNTGGVNVIDLANIHSCSFIATQDLGKINAPGFFEISGRFDNSDLRGCNLLFQ